MSPLVSVITPTWGRHDTLLGRCIPSVAAQLGARVEHIVVSDGPDNDLYDVLKTQPRPGLRYAELEAHDASARWGHWARLAGIEMAQGEYIAYLDDDNAYRPSHLMKLVSALEADPDADFAYGKVHVHITGRFGGLKEAHYEIGTDPPIYGQIDTSAIVHRPEILKVETWLPSLPTIDWHLVNRWMMRGMKWIFIDEVTVDYFK
jgi:glycosyltransferase involved in cell wall biosynthesis